MANEWGYEENNGKCFHFLSEIPVKKIKNYWESD